MEVVPQGHHTQEMQLCVQLCYKGGAKFPPQLVAEFGSIAYMVLVSHTWKI